MTINKTVIISPDVLTQEVSGEMILLDLSKEQYLGLNDVGTKVWQLLQEGKNLEMVFETLLEEYDIDAELLKSDLNQLISDMHEAEVVEVKEIQDS
jgi:hypothetical protein